MNIFRLNILCLLSTGLLLFGCSSKDESHPNTMDEMISFLDDSEVHNRGVASKSKISPPITVTESLVPDLDVSLNPISGRKKEDRFDIAVQAVPAKEFFMGLVAGTRYSMVVNPKVAGEISLNLKGVTIREALSAARDAYGYEYETTNYGFKIMPAGLITKIFSLDYLNVKRTGKSTTTVSAGQLTSSGSGGSSSSGSSGGSSSSGGASSRNATLSASVGTEIVTDFWPELSSTVHTMIGSTGGRSVVVSPQTGIIIVRALPDELRAVERYLDRAEKSLNRQVIIEAKILEVTLKDSYQSGIDWGFLTKTLGQASSTTLSTDTFPNTENLEDFTGVFTLAPNLSRFTMMMKLLSTQGNVQVLSSPRISTVNNQKAIIKVGQDEFFVTDVSGSTSQGSSASSTSQSQSIELTPFFSGISLDVTPHVDRKGNVILHIHPTISEVIDKTKTVSIQGQTSTLPSALSSVRESDNIVKAKNGQVIIIGGLMKSQSQEGVGKTPFLGDVPGIGTLFRRTRQVSLKSELVILLRPIVVGDKIWSKEIKKTKKSLGNVKRGFHFGSKGHIFRPSAENDPS